ncbi:MAG: tetratricopeptide repeat protein [Candidatus Micrarchaeia archaeon]
MLGKKKSSAIDARTYYQQGNDYYEKGDFEKAIENYNMAILLSPVFSEAYFNRALSYYQLKNFEKGIKDYSKAAELDPKNPIIYNNRGDAYYRKQDYHTAVKDYDKAISLNPEYLKAFYNRGLSYASLEDYDKAVEDFTKVVELKDDFAEAYHLRGLAFEYNGNLDKAVSDYEKAIKLNPELEDAKTHLDSAKTKLEQSGGGTGEGGEGKSDIKMLEKPNMRFTDVAGMEKMKEEIRDGVVYPMVNPELARKYGKLGGGGILMYGPPGCGKCIKKDTPVLLSNGKLESIEEIYNQFLHLKEKKIEKDEFLIENPDIEVLSLNPKTLKIEKKKVQYLYKQKYTGKLYEVITHSGRKITVTPEHPFLKIFNGVEKTKTSKLKLNDYIAIPRKTFIDNTIKQEEDISQGFREILPNRRIQYISRNHPKTRAIQPVYEVDENIAEYFGYLLSEGASIPGTMYFSNSDQNLIRRVADTTKNRFGIEPRIKPDTSEGVFRVEIGSVSLIKFLELVHGFKLKGSRNAQVPKSILCANDEIAGKFLCAVFESEACVRLDVAEIEFSTSSEKFANEIAYLLLRFGIFARIKQKRIKNNDHIYWRIYLSSHRNLKKFEEKIGFVSEEKKRKLKKWTLRNIAGSTATDIVPNIQELLKESREYSNTPKNKFYDSKNGNRYETFRSLSKEYLKKIVNTQKTKKELQILADSDVIWDRVDKIKILEIDDYVYDLTIEDNHTFIAGFGGIVTHNTFVIKASAGECDSGFINAKLSDLLDMYVGNTEKNIHKVFELARKNVPCILFFDEVDAIGGRRDQGQGQQYLKMAVNQLLYEMDGVEANNQNVLVVGATNAPWDVDPALRRSGRFSKTIYIPAPDFTSRMAILKIHSKKRPVKTGIPFWRLALATTSYASADLKAVVEEAASYPWKEAFRAIEGKKEMYINQGLSATEAKERANKEVKQREVNTSDYLRAIKKVKSTLPPWYEQAKKQIGKQEEVTIIDGKKHIKQTESKMGPGEKHMFKSLLDVIEKQTKFYNKWFNTISKYAGLYLPIPF